MGGVWTHNPATDMPRSDDDLATSVCSLWYYSNTTHQITHDVR